ncbi:DUF2339 domain-containing protein [Lysobacter sp. Root983]|uniref:DUF2339 domain-containing protein n=1 Tax=Lysobacter sp. Root983 TaxID=1736613 RepID=UPI00070A975A|nr:DUF2339 domain-containing protein [Lysobacter sp. Root983]KRD77552.1 hypothetical protein ASE43_10525 [Lysobacter sp. Root983]
MEGLLALLVLVLLAVPVLLIIALVSISGLKARVGLLEARIAELAQRAAARPTAAVAVAEEQPGEREPTLGELMRDAPLPPAPVSPPPSPVSSTPPGPPPRTIPGEPAAPTPAAEPASALPPPLPASAPRPIFEESPRAEPARAARAQVRAPAQPDPIERMVGAVKRWFTEGNVPVKVGMLVLFAGVAALLKYATDQGWMRFPIEFRLAGIALAALAGLVFGWRQRERKRSFALSLQGGAIGVLLLVVFAAFKLYGLIEAGPAFALSIVLVAGAGVLAVRQNAIALALLGIFAGFMAPIWLSTGQGNHVALFSYYAVLNAAIFVIAWWRPWRALNLLGFVFTFGIGTAWGVLRYRSADFASTEPFLLLFFVFYLLIPILYAWRQAAGRRDFIDGCLVFGTPLVAFSLQAGLLEGERMPLAFCALGLAVLYAALAWWLKRREHFVALATPYALLAVGFATLAVPLALSAQTTACVFAVEGAALVWLGLRQQRILPQLAGLALQLFAAGGFLIGISDGPEPLTAVLNARFMGALLIALAGFASAWSYRRAEQRNPALMYYLWGLAWWCGNAWGEFDRFLLSDLRADASLAFVAFTAWLAAEAYRRLPTRALSWTVALGLAAALPLALVQETAHLHPFAGYGLAAWLVYALAGLRALRCLRDRAGAELAFAHAAWLWAWPLAASLSLHEFVGRATVGDGWTWAALALPFLLMAAALQWRPEAVAPPLSERFRQWRGVVQGSFVFALALGAIVVLGQPGGSAPLPWVPLLNPLDLIQLAVLALFAFWLASPSAPDDLRARRVPLLAAAGFALITAITLRATHHWGGVPWDGSMYRTGLVQTSLTVVWSLLGVLGWVIGSRRGQRGLWLAGAVLMAVVLAKLVFVDRTHLGNLLGIASFIAYGLLCTLVGYLAPAPPATSDAPAEPPSEMSA